MSVGYVYILVSQNSDCIKIGGTDYPPRKRLREINSSEPYRSLGPWTLSDFREVTDWRAVEAHLHYMFRSAQASEISGQRELFRIAPHSVSTKLLELDPALVLKRPVIDRMFQDLELSSFILKLFAFTGLLNWLDIQGAWTFSLFPGTSGGRYFTINIGRHEVAFSTLPKGGRAAIHVIVLDRLIYDFSQVIDWVNARGGNARDDAYASALPRSVCIQFEGSFEDAIEFLELDGVRRALIAYWMEGLMRLKEKGSASFFARFHNWNAIAEIRARSIAEAAPVLPTARSRKSIGRS